MQNEHESDIEVMLRNYNERKQRNAKESYDKMAREELEREVELLREENRKLSERAKELEKQASNSDSLAFTPEGSISTENLYFLEYSVDGSITFQIGLFRIDDNADSIDILLKTDKDYVKDVENGYHCYGLKGIDTNHCFCITVRFDHQLDQLIAHYYYYKYQSSWWSDKACPDDIGIIGSYDWVRLLAKENGLLGEYDPFYTNEREMIKVLRCADGYYLRETKGHQKIIGERKERQHG